MSDNNIPQGVDNIHVDDDKVLYIKELEGNKLENLTKSNYEVTLSESISISIGEHEETKINDESGQFYLASLKGNTYYNILQRGQEEKSLVEYVDLNYVYDNNLYECQDGVLFGDNFLGASYQNLLLNSNKEIVLDDTPYVTHPLNLSPNSLYTLRFECCGTNEISVILGGKELNIPIDEKFRVYQVEITTPTILVNKDLHFMGVNNQIRNLVLTKGNVSSELPYFEDFQDSGNLLEEGTYEISFKITNNYDSYWDEY